MDELLALLGQNWRLLWIYPGGLSALGALLMFALLADQRARLPRRQLPAALVIAAVWLVVIALLPLPQTGWSYPLDLLALLLLIELPFWLLLARHPNDRSDHNQTIVALLNIYPLLALAIALLGQTTGSLVVREINRSTELGRWLGVSAWALTLPPLLSLGPWRCTHPRNLISALRGTTHCALLLAVALPVSDTTSWLASAIGWLAIVLPLGALDHWWRGDGSRWIRWQPGLCGVYLVVIAWLSGQRLVDRLF